MPFQFLAADPFMGRPGLSGKAAWAPFSGAVVDMDFKAGQYFGTTAAALTASTGSLKITASGLQVVTGDLIVTTNAALLAALNSATTVIRVKAVGPDITTASSNGFFSAKTGANGTLAIRLRSSPNQSGLAAGHSAAGATVTAFAAGATGGIATGAAFVAASRHRTTNCGLSVNGAAIVSSVPAGKSSTVDTAQFGIGETGVVLNSYIERLTIWTDDPDDTTLRARAT